ncbi:hypothetical protein ACFWIN_24310 [Streptomyces sp. NPDC127049]|uniref:hypothetical protein n=1 Tax=Streptomyces sp. NPDC127049 TaxID=3347118 RepID=UPI00365B274E
MSARHMSVGVCTGWARVCRNSATIAAAVVAAAGLAAAVPTVLASGESRPVLGLQSAELGATEEDFAWG